MTAAGTKRAEKESRARSRACFEREVTHLRAGDWWRAGVQAVELVELVGMPADLHGTVCTCCPGSRYRSWDLATRDLVDPTVGQEAA